MLEELDIRNLGPIREATIAPAAGMTAITGETGAGKSMLLSAIRLVSGGAAESSRVSAGADEAWAQAIFALADDAVASEHSGDTNDAGDDAGSDDADSGFTGAAAAVAKAHDAGVDPEDGELFLSRTVRASGRSRAVLGGKSVPRSVLGAIAGELVTIHGQTDQLKIAAAAPQREVLALGEPAGEKAELAAYRKAWDALAAMDERLERLRSQESSARQQADYLRESIDRINRTDPQPGEDEELKARRERIENAADIAQGVGSALGALDASQVDVDAADGASAVELINHAVTSLRAIRVGGTFSEQADRLESINADLGDVVFALSQELGDEGSVEDLDQINGRIHELGDLARRWGPTLADVLAWRDKAAFDLEDLDASPEKVAELESERQTLYDAALAAADVLSAARVPAAADLGARVTEELGSLAMLGASLEVRVTPRDKADDPLGPYGRDDIAFLFTPFEGSPQLPMGKSASGGELSRLMLALELVAADTRGGADQTFIFDEVDAGVGGKAAVELGKRLARLARSAQVIVVTHLAQVASWADAQFVVTKEPPDADDDDLGVVTTIAEVNGETRVHEIARMLSGSESEASLDHARELLKESVL